MDVKVTDFFAFRGENTINAQVLQKMTYQRLKFYWMVGLT